MMKIPVILILLLIFPKYALSDANQLNLPDFSLYGDSSLNNKKEENVQDKAPDITIPNIKNQDLSVKHEEIPQYIKDMINNNAPGMDVNEIAKLEAKKREAAQKDLQEKADREKIEKDKAEKDRKEAEDIELKKKKEEEKEKQIKLMEEQYRVFDHRPKYDPRTITTPDQLHKEQYGPNNKHLPPFINLSQYTRYLFLMTIEENISAMKGLIHSGADINARDEKNRYTPLMYAAFHKKNKSLEWLLSNGADINAQDINGRTALHISAIRGNLYAMDKLLKMKPSIEIVDNYGKRAIEYSSNISNELNIDILNLYKDINLALLDFLHTTNISGTQKAIEAGANINTQYKDRNTPLHIAVTKKSPQLVSLLLQHNPDMNIKNANNEDPIATSQRIGDHYIWALLKTHLSKEQMNDKLKTSLDIKPMLLLPNSK